MWARLQAELAQLDGWTALIVLAAVLGVWWLTRGAEDDPTVCPHCGAQAGNAPCPTGCEDYARFP